jgi:hypothetical protein
MSRARPTPGHYYCDSVDRLCAVGLLKPHEDYCDCVTYCNEVYDDSGSGMGYGEWWYADDKTYTIYSGTFSNSHSPGSYIVADVYATIEEYCDALAEREAQPEYIEPDDQYDEPLSPDEQLNERGYNDHGYNMID